MDDFYSCSWLASRIPTVEWADVPSMLAGVEPYLEHIGSFDLNYFNCIHYCKSVDGSFVLRSMRTYKNDDKKTVHVQRLWPVNAFGPRISTAFPDAETRELKFVPVCLDEASAVDGDVVFLECGELADDSGESEDEDQTVPVNLIKSGESSQEEFFSKLYVGFLPDDPYHFHPYLPHAFVDLVEVLPDNTAAYNGDTLRLAGKDAPLFRQTQHSVDPTAKYTFSFLADEMPDVHSIFYVHGRMYLAEKITATFTEEGMQRLMKMTAYRMKTERIR